MTVGVFRIPGTSDMALAKFQMCFRPGLPGDSAKTFPCCAWAWTLESHQKCSALVTVVLDLGLERLGG